MLGRYLEHFDAFIQFARSDCYLLLGQENATSEWQASFDSVVEAVRWDLFPGMDVVLVLLDDSEFGKDIKWFFSPAVKNFVDFKLLLVFVETSMELMLTAVQDSEAVQKALETSEIDAVVMDRGTIHSPSYCFNFDTGNIVPKNLENLVTFIDEVKQKSPFDAIFVQESVFKKPIFCWHILNGIDGCIARDAACMGGYLHLRLNKSLPETGLFSTQILAMAKIQLEIITRIIDKSLERESE